MTNIGGDGIGLWDEEDEFYLRRAAPARTAERIPLRVRSMVGLIPLFAVEVLEHRDARTGCRISPAG